MITLPRTLCINLNEVLKREWLVTNGIGGYASSTPAGLNTRRYHGLLVAALKPPVERMVLLSGIEEEITIEDRSFYLGANEYTDGKIHPGGFIYIEEFRLYEGIPTTTYRLGKSVITKSVWMEYGHNTTYVRYTYIEGTQELAVALHIMCNYRDYHAMTEGSFDWNFEVEPVAGGCKVVAKEGAAPYWLTTRPEANFTPTGVWYWNHIYREEVARGYEDNDDVYSPGVLRARLRPGESLTLVASTESPEQTSTYYTGALEREQRRQQRLLLQADVPHGAESAAADNPLDDDLAFVAELVRAADTFLVERKVGTELGDAEASVPTVIAGYHWFTDWGRDTMIALPGLCIPTGRTELVGKTLRTFARYAHEGLIPNNFPDSGDPPMYNTADATLWLFATLGKLVDMGDTQIATDLYPTLVDIIRWHIKGTRYGIGMDRHDYLLHAGEEGYQLTWMDAKIDNWVVTPRIGKPVEINALWCNALLVMSRLSRIKGVKRIAEAPDYKAILKEAQTSFRERFWYAEGGYLYDVIDGPDGNDHSLRPNQLLALSLMPGLVTKPQAESVIAVVRKRLLTPYGLRTLDPAHPDYQGVHTGNRLQRDGAYHQGTIWPWLLGPYFDAVRAYEGDGVARADLLRMMPELRTHLGTAGLGTISEIFDGDAPHPPKGCISQAWSVAEVLRQVWGPHSLLNKKPHIS